MKVDLFKLNNLGKTEVDSDITIPTEYFGTTGVKNCKNVHVSGMISIDYDDNIAASLKVTGAFVLSDAYTLEDIDYDFDVDIDSTLGKFMDFYDINKNVLDILPFIWENIVSEVPIRVTKCDNPPDIKGNGWELKSSD
ncbi:MAG TPA: hypothetical protein PLB45_03705 [Bacilli bacterium]|nr:hypothetical protein [Bacilli bacterium]HQC83958.1 hypothetical protein [Bacilli bacterium]